MRQLKQPSRLPKTFLICVETKDGKSGYVRYLSYPTGNDFKYELNIVKKMGDASRYISLDNSKIEAKKIKEKHGFPVVHVVDETTKKMYPIH